MRDERLSPDPSATGSSSAPSNAIPSEPLHSFPTDESVTVSQPGEPPRELEALPALWEADAMVDLAVAIVSGSIGVGLAVFRRVGRPVLRSRALWRPPFLPTNLQPATLVTEVVRRGARQRAAAAEQAGLLLDQWTPALVDLVISRLDLTDLIEQVLADIDFPTIIRDSTGPLASQTVRGARMTGITADEAITRALERHLFRGRETPSVGGG
jgi:hypothetical protein